jgi:uncharacterized membrane-anchored protein
MNPETTAPAPSRTDQLRAAAPSLVPAFTGGLFWTTKILTTGAGEVASDYLGRSAFAVVEVALAGVLFVWAMVAQFKARTYSPTKYWLAALMVSVFGTSVADIVHVVLGVSYVVSTLVLAVMLAVVLTWWRRSEGTLSIHTVNNVRRQRFYWSTVMITFALGTAAGDMFARNLDLGYFWPGVLFAGLILLPLAGWRAGLNAVGCFWTAYILTRPLGASFSDWVAVEPDRGGLGVGPGTVALALFVAIAVVLAITEAVERSARRQAIECDLEELDAA